MARLRSFIDCMKQHRQGTKVKMVTGGLEKRCVIGITKDIF